MSTFNECLEEFLSQPDLRCVREDLRDLAQESFSAGDARGFVMCANSGNQLTLVLDNHLHLKRKGMLEAALIEAYVGTKVNTSHLLLRKIESLFLDCDRPRLRALGDALPGPGAFQVYRGVAGDRDKRRARGYSWTDSLEIACWFAVTSATFSGREPAIYTASLPDSEVLFFTDGRQEREFVGRPRTCRLLPMSKEQIFEASKRYRPDTSLKPGAMGS